MAQTLEEKQRIVSDLNEIAANAHSAIAADYRGLTVSEMTQLRSRAREQNIYLRVIKNTLARRGLSGTSYQCMSDKLTGPLVWAFSQEDPGAAAQLFKEFAKEHDSIEVKLVAVEGMLMDISMVDRLANLPTCDEAIAMLMATMKAPITQFVRVLTDVPSKLVRVFAAVKEQKEQSALPEK